MDKLVSLDIETSNGKGSGSLDPRAEGSTIALVQLAFEDGSIELNDWNQGTEEKLIRLSEQGYRFVIHNASFELSWFYVKSKFRPEKIWDTMIASQVLHAGKTHVDEATAMSGRMEAKNTDHVGVYNPLLEENDDNISEEGRKVSRFAHSLQAVVYRHLGEKVTKDQGTSDWLRRPLTPEQERYAKDDVRYGIAVARKQWQNGLSIGLDKVLVLEMDILPAVASMAYHGLLVDQEKWAESAAEYAKKAEELESELNPEMGLELAKRESVPSLFGNYIPKAFKVSSPAQLAKFFGTDNADEAVLRSIDHPLIPKILEYKENQKIASTYSDSYFKFIHEDGRIHSSLIQAETATGRFSSKKPALQTIPAKMIKGFTDAGEGMAMVFADYSSVESRILAYVSGDRALIETVNSQDIHWENAKGIYKLGENAPRFQEDGHTPVMYDVNGEFISADELRSKAKIYSFSIPYGVSAVGLYARGAADSKEEAQEKMDNFFETYPEVYRFLKNSAAEAITQGYNQNPFGRVRWYHVLEGLDSKELEKRISSISRQAFNMKIQSLSADITKVAILNAYRYLKETGYGNLVLTIHDSIFFELKIKHLSESVPALQKIMEDAGPFIYPGLVTPVDMEIGERWKDLPEVQAVFN